MGVEGQDLPDPFPQDERERVRDHLHILAGTSQNVLGIGIAALATFAAQILISNSLGAPGFGVVTVLTQAAFVLSFLTRAGMDMAVLRQVAVEVGRGDTDRVRVPVARAAMIAAAGGLAVAAVAFAAADALRSLFSIDPDEGRWVVEAAALGLPFISVANVWLAASRGLKIMRYTLYVFWAGQPLVWIAVTLLAWTVSRSASAAILAYSLSWAVAAGAAWWFWRRETRGWPAAAPRPGDAAALARYAGPRAPAALFAQLLFWTDLFVLTRYAPQSEIGVYSAALRSAQILVLFLTSVSLMFSPFVADLHARGERRRLDGLFKALTRWTLAATLPLFLLLAIAPEPVLRLFGQEFSGAQTALLILIAGQAVNVATGSVGFVLIMAGRTGWDLVVYAGSFVLDLTLAFILAPRYGMEGAAIAGAVTFGVSNAVRLALVRRFVGIQPYDRHYARLVLPALAGGAAMFGAHRLPVETWQLDLVVTAVAGAAVYALAYLAVGLTPGERRSALVLLRRSPSATPPA